MMRKTLSVCSLILVIVMLASVFAACGSKDEEKTNIPAGTYKLTELDLGSAKIAPAVKTVLTIEEDGTGKADSAGETFDLKVKSSDEITIGEETYTYKLEDGDILITDFSNGELSGSGGSTWRFEKQ